MISARSKFPAMMATCGASDVSLTSVSNIHGMHFVKSQTYLKGSLAVVILYFPIGPPEQENPCAAFLNDTKGFFFRKTADRRGFSFSAPSVERCARVYTVPR